ncbi:MAG: hypothetical protein IJJ40_05625 [Clostridia bacterium]|nr:hypothetical protein [Clostridia bacterium]MBR3145601.1 hypothetical protein [Clostridia bacterium]
MKKIISLLAVITLLFCLSACGKSDDTVYEGDGTNNTATVDLTTLSSTMVYSEVSQMMTHPETYEGKTIVMNGVCSLYYNTEDQEKTYYACVIKDATACCSQGLEFVLKDGQKYPELDTEIKVKGVFSSYNEDGQTYYHISDAELL